MTARVDWLAAGRDGRFIETVGRYNPQTSPSTIVLDEERIRDWIAKGAQPTDQVRKLMRQIGRGKMPDIGALMRGGR